MTNTEQTVAILTDSAADIPAELAAEHGIEVVHLSVNIAGKSYVGNELSSKELLKRMHESGEIVTTSLPPIGDFESAYRRLLEKYKHVVSVHVGPSFSGTIESAYVAAKSFPDQVEISNTKSLSMGEGLQAIAAAKLAKAGASLEEVLAHLNEIRPKAHQFTGFDTLEYLHKGGRIGRGAALLGSVLNLKPSIYADRNGEFAPFTRSAGEKGAIRDTMKWISQTLGDKKEAIFAVGYAFHKERAEKVAAAIHERFKPVGDLIIYEAGPAVSTHTGPGWGVSIMEV